MHEYGECVSEPSLHDKLNRMIANAVHTMTQLSGGVSVCKFTKTGQAVPGIKYAEGQWAALRALQRELKTGVDPKSAIVAGNKHWQDKLAESIEHSASSDWQAYHRGAADAVLTLARER